MEPFDIDKIIAEKLKESNDLHEHEMDTAKPFVWSAVQNQLNKKRSLTWYHLAAAVLLLMIGFSFVLYNVQNKHNKEIELLSTKVEEMQRNYLSQVELLHAKDSEVVTLGNDLRNVEKHLADMNVQQQKPLYPKEMETIVYRTDTVYLTRVEYITKVAEPIESKEVPIVLADEITNVEAGKTDDVIFPSYTNQGSKQPSETIKFKFGPVVARKN